MHKVYHLQRAEPILEKILNANIHLAAQVSIQTYIITGLREAFQIEKKKRQKAKRLNLLGEDDVRPQFYSPARIKAAQGVQNAKTAEEQANRQRIIDNKVKAVANRLQKEASKAERALQAQAWREHAQEEKVRKLAKSTAKKAQKQAVQAAKKADLEAKKLAKLASKLMPKPTKPAPSKKKHVVVDTDSGGRRGVKVASATTRTQAVARPARYR